MADAADRIGDVAPHDAPLADRVLRGRRAGHALARRIGHRGAVADRPDVLEARDLQAAVGVDPALLVERQAEPCDDRMRLDARSPDERARRHDLAVAERRACSRVTASSVVFVRISMPRKRSSRTAKSASFAPISGITRSLASTRIQRMPVTRQRG